MKRKILVVEDDLSICDLICIHLKKNDFDYHVVHTGEDALAQLEVYIPDFIILDWMIPNLSGLEVLKRIKNRSRFKKIPVLMLTARNSEQDKVVSFENGLDDYITKPFLPSELIARVKSLLRRANTNINSSKIVYDDLLIDANKKIVQSTDKIIKIGKTEYKILSLLMSRPENVFSRDQIIDYVWDKNPDIDDRTVDVHVSRLRKTFKENYHGNCKIETVHGFGYCIRKD